MTTTAKSPTAAAKSSVTSGGAGVEVAQVGDAISSISARNDRVLSTIRFQPETIDVGRADRAKLWQGAMEMADRLPDPSRLASWDLRPTLLDAEAREVLRLWWYEPTRAEAEAMGEFFFEGDEAGAQVHPLRSPYVFGDIVGQDRVPRPWRQGSSAVSPLPAKIGLRVAMFTRRLLGK